MMRLLFVVAAALLPLQAAAQCHLREFTAYSAAQRAYHVTVERLVATTDTSLRASAALMRQEQVARIDARERAFQWLLANDAAKLRLDRPINQWLDWGRDEARALAARDTTFARLDARMMAARMQATGLRDGDRVRELVQGTIAAMPAHREAMDRVTTFTRTPRCRTKE